MAGRKPRSLSAEERALWQKVVEHDSRMHPKQHAEAPKQTLFPQKTPRPEVSVPRFRLGETAPHSPPGHVLAPSLGEHLGAQPLAMDRKRYGKMKKGRLSPEARLDLHGMTTTQAYPALTRFILAASAREARLVLVITGKGKLKDEGGPIPERLGVLRHQLPHWLNTAPLRAHVLQITEAHVKHGGQGAYYVYLRRAR